MGISVPVGSYGMDNFGVFHGRLAVHFMAFWYLCGHFGIFFRFGL
jgi:hypothetical protein